MWDRFDARRFRVMTDALRAGKNLGGVWTREDHWERMWRHVSNRSKQ